MKKILLLFTILFVSVFTTACINNFAIQELNNKAESYMDRGDTETAICRLRSSLDLDNEIFETHYNLAVAYNSIGKHKEAIVELNKAIELKPDFADAYYTLAVAKESVTYSLIENIDDPSELSLDEITEFNNNAASTVEAYNEYLVKKIDANDTSEINSRIEDLNQKIKEFTDIYDSKSQKTEKEVEQELDTESEIIE